MILPLLFPKTREGPLVCNCQRAFYKHTIGCKKLQLLLLCHLGQLVLQAQLLIQIPAGIEKAL